MNAAKKSSPPITLVDDPSDARFVEIGKLIVEALSEADALEEGLLGIRLQESFDAWEAAAKRRNLIE